MAAAFATSAFAGGGGSGNVTTDVRKGVLTVTGDGNNNWLTVMPGIQSASYVITGDGTTVDGGTDPVTHVGITRDLKIDLTGGANNLILVDTILNRKLFITTGAGDDTVLLDNVVVDLAKIEMGDGANDLDINNCDIARGKTRGGDGVDDFSVFDTTYFGKFDTRENNDIITLDQMSSQNKVLVKAGHGDDTATITNLTYQKINVNMGRGLDNATIGNIMVAKKGLFNGNGDTDTLTDNGGHTGPVTTTGFEVVN